MPDANPNLMTIFAEALERTDPAARGAYLEAACEGNDALRRRVEALLSAHDGAGRFLERESAIQSETTAPGHEEATRTSVAGVPTHAGNGDGRTPTGRDDHRVRGHPSGRPTRRLRRRAGHRRSLHAARGPRRGRHGHRLPRRADPAGQAAGGAQADQDRHGFARRPGPVRRRAAGTGLDGPPQHRPRLRRRHHLGRPAVLRDGAGARRADYRLLRP